MNFLKKIFGREKNPKPKATPALSLKKDSPPLNEQRLAVGLWQTHKALHTGMTIQNCWYCLNPGTEFTHKVVPDTETAAGSSNRERFRSTLTHDQKKLLKESTKMAWSELFKKKNPNKEKTNETESKTS